MRGKMKKYQIAILVIAIVAIGVLGASFALSHINGYWQTVYYTTQSGATSSHAVWSLPTFDFSWIPFVS